MTLTDCEENACCQTMQPTTEQQESHAAIGLALRDAVWQAQEQGRLYCGVMECAHLLEIDPFSVMMCVIPVSIPDDVSGIIERTLIEAFCHEYQIRLIKVDSVNKLCKLLEGRDGTSRASGFSSSSSSSSSSLPSSSVPEALTTPAREVDNPAREVAGSSGPGTPSPLWELCSCLLLQYPESGETSEEEETVAQHYKKTTTFVGHEDVSAVVALPDD